MKIRMRHDNCLVRRLKDADITQGGLYLIGREKCNLGHVISTGPGKKSKKGPVGLAFEVGDMVMFEKFSGFPLLDSTEPGVEYVLLRHNEIILCMGKVEVE